MQKATSLLIDNINNLPLWVKQILAKEVSKNLINKLGEFIELTETDTLLQYMKPLITFKGRHELENKYLKLSDGYYIFLGMVLENENLLEITLKNNWSLADSAKILCSLTDMELINIPDFQKRNYALAQFIANQIKTGEFLKKLGKIDANNLEEALKLQIKLKEEGRQVKLASILIKMGYISSKGLDSLLLLKEEAQRRLPLCIGLTSLKYEDENEKNDYVMRLQKEIARLEAENTIMKNRLKKLLRIDEK